MQDATYADRIFLTNDASDVTLVAADVITSATDEDGFLQLEASFRLGDGQNFATLDVSVFEYVANSVDAAEAIKVNLAKVRNLKDQVDAWATAYTDAAIEALSEVQAVRDAKVEVAS